MKMKKLSVALIAAGLMSSQAVMASDAFGTSTSQNGLSFAFENSSTMNYAALSHTEMVETEGEWFMALISRISSFFSRPSPVRDASVGSISSSVTYAAANAGSDRWSLGGQLQASASGAVVGVLSPNPYMAMTAGSLTGGVLSRPELNGNNTDFGYHHPGNAGYGPNR